MCVCIDIRNPDFGSICMMANESLRKFIQARYPNDHTYYALFQKHLESIYNFDK